MAISINLNVSANLSSYSITSIKLKQKELLPYLDYSVISIILSKHNLSIPSKTYDSFGPNLEENNDFLLCIQYYFNCPIN